MIAHEIGSRAPILSMPPWLAFQGIRVLGWMVGDVINTRDEVKGLMQARLYVESPALGTTKLSDWVRANREKIGRQYASELQRRFDRVSENFLASPLSYSNTPHLIAHATMACLMPYFGRRCCSGRKTF